MYSSDIKLSNRKMLLYIMKRYPWCSDHVNCRPNEACCKPSDQPRDAARREECSDLDEKSLILFVVVMRERKGLLESTKMDFYET